MNNTKDTDDTDGAFGCAFLLMLVLFATIPFGCITREVSKNWEKGKIEAHQEAEKTSNQ